MIFNPPQGQWVNGRFVLLPQPSNARGFSTGNAQADQAINGATVSPQNPGYSQDANGNPNPDPANAGTPPSDNQGSRGSSVGINPTTAGSLIGSSLGLAAGVPGLGTLGALGGMALDYGRANNGRNDFNSYSGTKIGDFNPLSALANALSPFGIFGTSYADQLSREMGRADGLDNPGGRSQAGQYDFDRMSGPATAPAAQEGYVSPNAGQDVSSGGLSDWGGFDPGLGSDYGYGGYFAKGGTVNTAVAPGDPPGPDDKYIAAQTGEYVVNRKASQKHKGLLEAINRGASAKELKGLLG